MNTKIRVGAEHDRDQVAHGRQSPQAPANYTRPPQGIAAHILHLQRTAGNQAVNQLLRQYSAQHARGSVVQRETASDASQNEWKSAVPSQAPATRVTVALWDSSVLNPIEMAEGQMSLQEGTATEHLSYAASQLQSTLAPIHAALTSFDPGTLQHENLQALLIAEQGFEESCKPYTGKKTDPGTVLDALRAASFEAVAISSRLVDSNTPSSAVTLNLWMTTVVDPLNEVQTAYFPTLAPDMTDVGMPSFGPEERKAIYTQSAEKLTAILERISRVVETYQGDPLVKEEIVILSNRVAALSAQFNSLLGNKADVTDTMGYLKRLHRMADKCRSLLILPAPAPTPPETTAEGIGGTLNARHWYDNPLYKMPFEAFNK